MAFLYCSLLNLNRSLTQPIVITLLASISVLCGIVPQLSGNLSQLSFSTAAYTQEFNDNQINNYARAVLLIETQRQQAYDQIQKIIGHAPPEIVCNRTETLQSSPRDAQKLAVQFCNNSKKIAENSGLTAAQFNAITEQAHQNEKFKRRIQDAIIRIRRSS